MTPPSERDSTKAFEKIVRFEQLDPPSKRWRVIVNDIVVAERFWRDDAAAICQALRFLWDAAEARGRAEERETASAAGEVRGRVTFAGIVQEIIGKRQREEADSFQRHGDNSNGGAAARHAYESLGYIARQVQAAVTARARASAGASETGADHAR